MKKGLLLLMLLISCGMQAQGDADPVLLTVAGVPVTRSEFVYAYEKNNVQTALERKSPQEYLPLFIDYRLKVQAALDAHLDTTQAFLQEYRACRDRQVKPLLITQSDFKDEARRLYDRERNRVVSNGGLYHVSHILISIPQKATAAQQAQAKKQIDMVYAALTRGEDFGRLAAKYSQDATSAPNGGDLGWVEKGQTLPEFEQEFLKLRSGNHSLPFLSPAGYHIVKLHEKKDFPDYQSLEQDILRYLKQKSLSEKILDDKISSITGQAPTATDKQLFLDQKAEELAAKDIKLKYLFKEYHDGLLLFAIADRTIWHNAARSEKALELFFKQNKKKYKWESPRYRGAIYHAANKDKAKAFKKLLKKADFGLWREIMAQNSMSGEANAIKGEVGIFRYGDNAFVDRLVFKNKHNSLPTQTLPITKVYGKKIKRPKKYTDVRNLVLEDYKEMLEKEWVKELRRKYKVSINQGVLQTIKPL